MQEHREEWQLLYAKGRAQDREDAPLTDYICWMLYRTTPGGSFLYIHDRVFGLIVASKVEEKLKHYAMKRFFSTLTILFLTATLSYAQEQHNKQDSTLISERTEGNYLIRQYKISGKDDEAQYTLKYSIAASKLPSLTAGNISELVDLDEMVAKLKQDSLMRVSHIEITGYASPDGNAVSNEKLALSRAEQFSTMLKERYALPSTYNVQIKADAEHWSDCDKAVQESSIGDKAKVLAILNSSASEASKEQELKALPKAWSVFRTEILPAMRRVEMTVYYNTDRIVEVRTFIEKPQPQPEPQVAQRRCSCDGFVDDVTIGIIVDMSEQGAIY